MKLKIVSLIIVFAGVAGIIYWIEAKKEIEILCSMIQLDQPLEKVQALLNTGELLRYSNDDEVLHASSAKNFHSLSCTAELTNNSTVKAVRFTEAFNLLVFAAILGAIGTVLLILFQLGLAIGRPWGEYAWGGFHKHLPVKFRIASGVSAAVLLLGAISMIDSAGVQLLPDNVSVVSITLFTLLFFLSVIGNLFSVSKKERTVMIPVSILLFWCYFIVAYTLL